MAASTVSGSLFGVRAGFGREIFREFGGFGFAPAEQAAADDASTMVPKIELSESFRELPRVDFAEKRGATEAVDADVEGEVDERVELRLGKLDFDRLIDAGGGGLDVAHEKSFGFILSNGHAGMDVGGVSITDGPEAALVLIRGEDVSFKKLGEVQAVFAIGEIIDSHSWILA